MKNSSYVPNALRTLLTLALVFCTCLPLAPAARGQRRGSSNQRSAGQTQPTGQRTTQRNSSTAPADATPATSAAGSLSGTANGQRAKQRTAQRGTTAAATTADPTGAEPAAETTGATPTGTTPRSARGTRPGGSAVTGAATGLAGQYVATTTGVAGGRGSAAADGFIRGNKSGQSSGQLAGTQLHIEITRFLSESEANQIEQASDGGQLPQVLTNLNCGSVRLGNGQTPIIVNAAISAQSATGAVIYLLSAQPFAQQGTQGRGAAAGAVGFIEMRLAPGAGGGKGSMYTSAQVGFNNGAVIVRGGASTAAQLTISRPGAQ